ncbi:kinesin family member C2/C3 [Nematocida minor]|uniref:kinesin family member C2/C3 n=1 Tax=Nematocida minor TaxID=1912983 RepID=UPI002220F23D|nr:kinesin family member C2/C3 [Nematocida minor]KAI5192715.1 kinesin family member C2/C3 [Nematocida minor]
MSFNTDRLSNILTNMEMNTSNLKYAMKNNISEILKKDTSSQDMEIKLLREEVRRLKESRETEENREAKIKTEENENEAESAKTIAMLTLQIEKMSEQMETQNQTFIRFKEQTESKIKAQLCEILQLKGAIRVVTRIKPFVSNEKVLLTDDTIEIPSKSFVSRCSKVLSPKTTQQDLFSEIEDLVYAVTKGYNVSILAYGPTGSGKTYSMEGPSHIHKKNDASCVHEIGSACQCAACAEEGVVYRSAQLLKSELRRMEVLGYTHAVRISAVEIYNDKIINSIEDAPSLEKITDIFKMVSRNRKIGSTECNLRSSRSHLIFTIHLVIQRSTDTGSMEYIEGSLCIADLAGSERLNHSKAEGERMKEAVEINRSLTALGDVVYAIANNTAHIPYRNSKLTSILKNTLGPGAKTAFIINVDPGASIEETVTALRFSNRLQECKLGRSKTVSLEVLK